MKKAELEGIRGTIGIVRRGVAPLGRTARRYRPRTPKTMSA